MKLVTFFKKILNSNFFCYSIFQNFGYLLFLKNLSNKIKKPNGISVCIRINKDIYIDNLLEQINMIYDYVDEIIIHYNSLKSTKMIDKFKNKSKIIIKKYNENLDFVKYTNDFLHEYKFKWLMMFDCDIIVDKQYFIEMISNIKKSKPNIIHFYSGINLFLKKSNQIGYVNLNEHNEWYLRPFVGIGDFFCFCPEYSKCSKLMSYGEDFKNISGKKHLHEVYLEKSFDYVIPIKQYKKKFWGIMFLHLSYLSLLNKFNEKIDDYFSLIEIKKNAKNIINLKKSYWTYFIYKKIIKKSNKMTINNLINKVNKNWVSQWKKLL